MNPAFSIVFFTAASGIGYGLLATAGLLAIFGLLPANVSLAVSATALALLLVSAGLISSLLHLGRPDRAWRALSQWRTSWLSREGVAALVAFGPALAFGCVWVFSAEPNIWLSLLGLITVGFCVLTVCCTAMIYASLAPVHEWHNRWVLPNYLSLSAMTGALWLLAVIRLSGFKLLALEILVVLLIVAGFLLKEIYWRFIGSTRGPSTIETATGLGNHGAVRVFERPHTEENYLLREMAFRIGRKHSSRLRNISRILMALGPLLLAALASRVDSKAGGAFALAAALSASLGVVLERWLFFAEAKHTVALYYGVDEPGGAPFAKRS